MAGKAAEALIYALGGGFGHVVRASSLAVGLEAKGIFTKVLVPKDRANLCLSLGARPVKVVPTSAPNALRAQVQKSLGSSSLLIVDAHPSGLLGELDPLPSVRCVLLYRRHRGATEPLLNYDLVIDIEPHLSDLPERIEAITAGPIIGPPAVFNARGAAMLFAWSPSSLNFMRKLACRIERAGHPAQIAYQGRLLPSGRPLRTLPGRGVSLVVGAAGYNLSYEALHQRVPHLAIPRARAFDEQHVRAQAIAECFRSPEALERRAIAILSGAEPKSRPDIQIRSAASIAGLLV